MAEAMMGAEADILCGAPYGQSVPERVNQRNGYRERRWDTRVEGLVQALGLTGMSKSQVSDMAKELDEVVESSATVLLTKAPTPSCGWTPSANAVARAAGW